MRWDKKIKRVASPENVPINLRQMPIIGMITPGFATVRGNHLGNKFFPSLWLVRDIWEGLESRGKLGNLKIKWLWKSI